MNINDIELEAKRGASGRETFDGVVDLLKSFGVDDEVCDGIIEIIISVGIAGFEAGYDTAADILEYVGGKSFVHLIRGGKGHILEKYESHIRIVQDEQTPSGAPSKEEPS